MRTAFITGILTYLFLTSGTLMCHAQNSKLDSLAKDTTPIETLDFRLSESQFHEYYGVDDTANAIIHMFYRHRGSTGWVFIGSPLLGFALGDVFGLIGAVAAIGEEAATASGFFGIAIAIYTVGFIVIPVIAIIQQAIYSRQKLLYVLVMRERGGGTPMEIVDKLRETDFRK